MIKGFWSTLFGAQDEPTSASVAKDRLKVIVASHDRLNSRLPPEQIAEMKREILAVVKKFIQEVQLNDLHIKQRHEDSIDVLEMNISLPDRK